MSLKSQKGITLVNLVVYVTSFLVISSIIASVTIFFYNNTSLLDKEVYSAAEYNKFNMYFVKESEEPNNKVVAVEQNSDQNLSYIQFSNGNKYTYDSKNHTLYFNKICLCEDVQGIKIKPEYGTGKETINVKIDFTNKTYTTNYTMMQ